MNKKYIEDALLNVGYSIHMIKAILERSKSSRPSYEKMMELNSRFNIPFEAWIDIKTFISTSSHKNKELQNV